MGCTQQVPGQVGRETEPAGAAGKLAVIKFFLLNVGSDLRRSYSRLGSLCSSSAERLARRLPATPKATIQVLLSRGSEMGIIMDNTPTSVL